MDPLDRQHSLALTYAALLSRIRSVPAFTVKDDFEPLPTYWHSVRQDGPYSSAREALLEQWSQFEEANLVSARIAVMFDLSIDALRVLRRKRHVQRRIRAAMIYHARHAARRSRRHCTPVQ